MTGERHFVGYVRTKWTEKGDKIGYVHARVQVKDKTIIISTDILVDPGLALDGEKLNKGDLVLVHTQNSDLLSVQVLLKGRAKKRL